MVTKEFAMASRIPVRMCGTVAGSATSAKTCARLAPRHCAARTLSRATAPTPAAVAITTTKTVV
jgi:hypothetical protein